MDRGEAAHFDVMPRLGPYRTSLERTLVARDWLARDELDRARRQGRGEIGHGSRRGTVRVRGSDSDRSCRCPVMFAGWGTTSSSWAGVRPVACSPPG